MKKTATQQQIIEHAIAAEEALEACAKLWQTGMEARLIGSKEYKQICSAGKIIQSVRINSFFDLEKRIGPAKTEKIMPCRTWHGFS